MATRYVLHVIPKISSDSEDINNVTFAKRFLQTDLVA
jgi:hypothetical protein